MPRFPIIPAIFLSMVMISTAVIVPNVALELLPQRSDIEAELSNRMAAEVRVEGDIRMRLLPRPQLIVQNITMLRGQNGEDLLAVRAPQLVVNLSAFDLLQQNIRVTRLTLIGADVSVKLTQNPAAFLAGLQARDRIDTAFLDSRFAVTGLNSLRPNEKANIDDLSLTIIGGATDAPLILQAQKSMPNGRQIMAALHVKKTGLQNELSLQLALGRDERMQFDGFIVRRNEDWQLDGEIAVFSAGLLADNIEQNLPLSVMDNARAVRLTGLVRGNKFGVLAETMEVEFLETAFRSRLTLDWPQQAGGRPVLSGRLSTGAVNLDTLSIKPMPEPQQNMLSQLWQSVAPALELDLRFEATGFELGGETGSDFELAFDWRDNVIGLERLSLNLPFSSALLVSGQLDLSTPQIGFAGNFSARSSDMIAAVLWAGGNSGLDLAAAAERVNEAQLQRASVVGDILLNDAGLALNGLSARVGNDIMTADLLFADSRGPQFDGMMRIDRFDLADWGLVEESAPMRDGDTTSVWPQLTRLLSDNLSENRASRLINLNLAIDEVFAGAQALGPIAVQAQIANQRLLLTDLSLQDIGGASVQASGQLNFDATPYYGQINLAFNEQETGWVRNWVLSGFGPFELTDDLPLYLQTAINLSGPDAADWPLVNLSGEGRLGDLNLALRADTPSRTLNLSRAGSDVSLTLSGRANALAGAFALPAIYRSAESGTLRLGVEAQTNDVSSLAGSLRMADDSAAVSGTLRPTAAGARIEGAMEFSFGDLLPLITVTDEARPMPLIGKTQINVTQQNLAFSGLDMRFGPGQVSGEGVLVLTDRLPRLNMTLAARDLDLGWLLPDRRNNAWSSAPMQWSLLGYGNADIGFQAEATRFGVVTVDDFSGRVKLTDGVLEAPSLAVSLMRGAGTLNLQAEGGTLPPRFNLDGTFNDLNPGNLFLQLYGNRLADAAFSGALSLSGRGNSAENMIRSLIGEGRYEIAPGVLSIFDAVGFGDDVMSASFSGSATKLAETYVGSDELSFARGIGLATLREGLIETANTDFVFADGLNEARLQATLDLLTVNLDGIFTLYPVDRQRPVTWQITGPIAKPQYKIDASAFDLSAAPAPSSESQPAN